LSIVTNQNQQFQQQNLQIQIVGHAQQQHAASVVTDNDVTMTDNSVQQQQQLPQYYSLPSMYWYAESAVVRDTYNNLQSERQTLSAANK
jgi:ABC-type Fe3+/spermidine/putrescine transport system ATPase subunit